MGAGVARVLLKNDKMLDDNLFDRMMSLRRKCIYLREPQSGERIVGIWGGSAVVRESSADCIHWCSLDCSLFSHITHKLTGWLSIFRKPGFQDWSFKNDQLNFDPQISNGILLAAFFADSLPPPAAVLIYGDDLLQQWFDKNDIFDERRFLQTSLGTRYNEMYQKSCPLYQDTDVFIQIGGWHAAWGGMANYNEFGDQLMLWTFRDFEPWVELWPSDSSFRIIARIS